jgi:hypothetical protein
MELLTRGPVPPEEFGLDPRAFHMVARELGHVLSTQDTMSEEEAAESPRPRAGGWSE